MKRLSFALFLSVVVGIAACGPTEVPVDPNWDPQGGKEDSWAGGVVDTGDNVWMVENAWGDRMPQQFLDSWQGEKPSGSTTYDEFYGYWLASFTHDGNGRDVHYRMADGTVVPAPSLECADTAMSLRFMYAAEFHLPMFIGVWGNTGLEFMGHFGWVTRSGYIVSQYSGDLNAPRGSDQSLQRSNRYLNDNNLFVIEGAPRPYVEGHTQDYPSDGVTTGAYYDSIMTNKRFGYFIQDVMNMAYSGDVAQNINTYYLLPEHMRAGDLQLHRSDPAEGIGHTITIQAVDQTAAGALRGVDLIQSYMPTRPWISGGMSELTRYRPNPENYSGLRRWRMPMRSNGKWYLVADDSVAADASQVSENPEIFERLFDVDPQAELTELVNTIDQRRAAQFDNPNSCNRRLDREDAFDMLYDVVAETSELQGPLGLESGASMAEVVRAVDRQYRTIDDFIWHEMTYEQSWVCHWNPPDVEVNNDMYRATVAFNRAAFEAGGCRALRVFRAENVASGDGTDGFTDLANFASSNGFQWATYNNDENGALSGVYTDMLSAPEEDVLDYFCELFDHLDYWQQP